MGKDTQEAILKVKMDLGKDAVILNTKKVRQKGIMGFFSKPLVEVLAAVDDEISTKKQTPANPVQNNPPQNNSANQYNANYMNHSKETNNFQQTRPPEPMIDGLHMKLEEKDEKINELENKVSNIENMLNKIYDHMQPTDTLKDKPVQKTEDKPSALPKILQLFHNNLIKNEVEPDLAQKIVDAAAQKVGSSTGVNDYATVLHTIISNILGKPETIKTGEQGRPRVIIFAGPTGVGKTTTLAKVAANYSLNHKKSVGFISADTYRIAAVEQLKTYAEILGIPMFVVYSATEIQDAIKKFVDKDIVLIDTAGRSHRNKTQFEELKTMISAANADEVYLVMSTTTSIRNCREILSNYDFIKDYKLIFTKLDETPINGIILNTRYLTGKSLSYVTNGQSVPDDIEIANVEKLAKNLLGSINQ